LFLASIPTDSKLKILASFLSIFVSSLGKHLVDSLTGKIGNLGLLPGKTS